MVDLLLLPAGGNGRGWRRWSFMPRAAPSMIGGPSCDSTGFVGVSTSHRFLAVCVFTLDWCFFHLPFIILSCSSNESFLNLFLTGSRDIRCSKGCNHHHHHPKRCNAPKSLTHSLKKQSINYSIFCYTNGDGFISSQFEPLKPCHG